MTLADDLLVDGISLSSGLPAEVQAGACVEGPWLWPYVSAGQRGDLPSFNGLDGVGYIDQPYSPLVLPVFLTLNAPACDDGSPTEQSDVSWAWLNNAVKEVRRTCKPDRPVTLTRVRSLPGATSEEHTAAAKLAGITPARPGRDSLRMVVEFTVLEGIWHGDAVTTAALTAGSHVIAVDGETRTTRISVVFAAGSVNPTVTNSTNGYAFTWTGTVPVGATVTVDVEARTATRVDAGGPVDVSSGLSWTKAHPFRLEPIDNTIVVSTGDTATITYAPAYL